MFLSPDWKGKVTAREFEHTFCGLKFSGWGWYTHNKAMLLLIPVGQELSYTRIYPEDQVYEFCVWNDVDPRILFTMISQAPRRV